MNLLKEGHKHLLKISDIWNLTLKTLAPMKMYFYIHYGEFTGTHVTFC